jgi:hypothetical protein
MFWSNLLSAGRVLEDPRTGNAGLHDFHELLMIALCTTLCGGQSAMAMARFAEAKESFLRGFLKLEHGLPSHDTPKDSLRGKFQRAGWDNAYLTRLLCLF